MRLCYCKMEITGIIHLIEQVAALSGIIYIYLEIIQSKYMWYVGIITSAACCISFLFQNMYVSFSLNVYYLLASVYGLLTWIRYKKESSSDIILDKLSRANLVYSLLFLVVGTFFLMYVSSLLGGENTFTDAFVSVLSVIATIWLAKTYIWHWPVWIFTDAVYAFICFKTGMHWLSLLYAAYSLSAIYGWIHWHKNGRYIKKYND